MDTGNPLLYAALQWQLDPLKGGSNWASWETHIQTPLNMLGIKYALTNVENDPEAEDFSIEFGLMNATNQKKAKKKFKDWARANGLCILRYEGIKSLEWPKHSVHHVVDKLKTYRKVTADLGHEADNLTLTTFLVSILGKSFSSWRRKVYEKGVDELVFDDIAKTAIAEEPYVLKPRQENKESGQPTGSDGNKKSNNSGQNTKNYSSSQPTATDRPDMSKPNERCTKHPLGKHSNKDCHYAPGGSRDPDAKKPQGGNANYNKPKGNNAQANKASKAQNSDYDDLARYDDVLDDTARGFRVKSLEAGVLDLNVDHDTEYVMDSGAEQHFIADKSKFFTLAPYAANT
ncbi:MAG: hypothetical protein Q9160_004075, partial [Pyrenula sp. 1 TL-2023]